MRMNQWLSGAAILSFAALLWVSFIVVGAGTADGEASEPALIAAKVIGKVQVRRAGSEEWEKVQTGDALNKSDTVESGAGGRAVFTLWRQEESKIFLFPRTLIEVADLANQTKSAKAKVNIKVNKGGAWVKIRKAQKQDVQVRVTTPNAVAAIQGTSLAVSVWGGKKSYFCACDGTIDISSPGGRVAINKAEGTMVAGESAPTKPESEKSLLRKLKNSNNPKYGVCFNCHFSAGGYLSKPKPPF